MYIFRSYANQIKQQRLFKRGNMKLNTCFENFGVSSVIFYFLLLCKKVKRTLDIHRIYRFYNGKLTIRGNCRAFDLYVKRSNTMFDMRESCANSFQKMFSMLYIYVIFTERQDEEYDFSQQLRVFSKLFRLYKKKALKAFKELETFREFKFDSSLKKEIFSLEFGKIKTLDKIEELSDKFRKEIFNQE